MSLKQKLAENFMIPVLGVLLSGPINQDSTNNLNNLVSKNLQGFSEIKRNIPIYERYSKYQQLKDR